MTSDEERIQKLAHVLLQLGLTDFDTFDGKKKIINGVYIAISYGIKLDYKFTLYLGKLGCPDLVRDLFIIENILSNNKESIPRPTVIKEEIA